MASVLIASAQTNMSQASGTGSVLWLLKAGTETVQNQDSFLRVFFRTQDKELENGEVVKSPEISSCCFMPHVQPESWVHDYNKARDDDVIA